MIRYVFLILNYKTFDETRNCVRSIDALDTNDAKKEIVIVDNDSNDKSFEKLNEEYKKRENVHVILHKINDGFSKGNNYGYEYIRDNFKPDFIIMINSDIEIKQKDFLFTINDIYMRTNFSVLGPDVYAYKMNLHQSPIKREIRNRIDTEKEIEKERTRLLRYQEQEYEGHKYVRDSAFEKIVDFFVKFGRKIGLDRLNWRKLPYWKEQFDVMIHGSALIFSKNYIRKYRICLYPMPFYYGEEDLLFLKCKKNHDRIVYSPKIKVYHSAGASATKASGANRTVKREIFRYKNLVETKTLYLQAIDSENYFDSSLDK